MIDAHTHIFYDETYESFKKRSKGEVEKALTIHISPHGKTKYLSLEEVVAFAKDKPDLAVVAGVDLTSNLESQFETFEKYFKDNTIVALKIYLGYQHMTANDPSIVKVAQFCDSLNRPLILHAGDVYDPEGVAILRYANPIFIDDLAVAVPNCKIVIAHFGWPYMIEAGNVVAKNKNVYTDISATLNDLGTEERNRINLETYAADLTRVFSYFPIVRPKVLFGSDYSGEQNDLHLFEDYVELVDKIFTSDEQDWVKGGLAKELFHL